MPTMKKVMQFVESPLDRMVKLIESGRFETGRNLDRDFDRFSASKYGSFKFDPKYNEGRDVERLKTPDYVYRGTPEYILEECADPSNELCNDFSELPPKLYEELMLRRKNFGKR